MEDNLWAGKGHEAGQELPARLAGHASFAVSLQQHTAAYLGIVLFLADWDWPALSAACICCYSSLLALKILAKPLSA